MTDPKILRLLAKALRENRPPARYTIQYEYWVSIRDSIMDALAETTPGFRPDCFSALTEKEIVTTGEQKP